MRAVDLEELDARIIMVLRQAQMARTWRVAQLLGIAQNVPFVRRRLVILEANGKVRRNERYTYPQDIMWEPVE